MLLVSTGQRASDDLFIRAALETVGTLALEIERVGVGALADRALAEYDFIILTDAGVVGPPNAELLTSYVSGGGEVLAAHGPRASSLSAVPITGHALESGSQTLDASQSVSISGVDSTHPALRGLDRLRSGKYSRYVGIVPGADDTVLLELDTGAPLLVERRIGDGRVLVYTSTLDRTWNDLPVQPVFVPLLAGLANYMLGGGGFSSEAALGSTLSVRALGMEGGQIFDPDGARALGFGGGTSDVVLERAGFYEAVGGGRTEVVAVNPDPRESDLTPVDDSALARWQGLGFAADGRVDIETDAGEAVAVPFGAWLLWVLVAALLMESLVGNWHLRVRRGIAT